MIRILILLLTFSVTARAQTAEPVCAAAKATLRKGPSASNPVSWKVSRYMPFMKVDRKGQWSKVKDIEGEEHWVKTSELTNKFRCVVVKTNVATLRKEPSTTAQTMDLKTVDRYTPFKRLANDREWVQVEDETGRQAWIHESQVWKPVSYTHLVRNLLDLARGLHAFKF